MRRLPKLIPLTALGVLFAAACGILAVHNAGAEAPQPPAATPPQSAPAEQLTPLNKQETVLLDKAGKRLLLKTRVVLREGVLEMLCCPKRSKEHESILSVDARAYTVHAGLLAIGAKPGKPVSYMPEFAPPTGQKIDIFVSWKDENGKLVRKPAQSWIRHVIHRYYIAKFDKRPADLRIPPESELRYDDKHNELIWYGPLTVAQRDTLAAYSNDKKYREAIHSFFEQGKPRQMDTHWVFAGSGFYQDPATGEKFYEAEGGDLICVSNFPSAMIDVAIPSSPSGEENLLFESYTEHVPPLATEVTLELIPVKDDGEAKQPPATGQKPGK